MSSVNLKAAADGGDLHAVYMHLEDLLAVSTLGGLSQLQPGRQSTAPGSAHDCRTSRTTVLADAAHAF